MKISASSRISGFIFGAIAAATYGLNPLFALPLYASGLEPNDVLFWRYLTGALCLLIMISARGQRIRVSCRTFGALIGLGLLMAISSLLLFESYQVMPAGIASTLLFVYPIMVAFIMSIIFHERLNKSIAICMIIAICGIGLLNKGTTDGISGAGIVMVMCAALAYALYLVFAVRGFLRHVPTLVLTFWVLIVGVILFGITSHFHGGIKIPRSIEMLGCALALGIVPTVISLVCTTIAIQKIGSTPTAILGALEPLTAVVVGIFVFDETLSNRESIGLVLILLAVIGVIAADKVAATLVRIRKLYPKFYHLIVQRKNGKA